MSSSPFDPGSVSLGGLRRQCLFGVTILLVEDSRSASEAIRLFAAESGARVRRADSLHAASRHLAIYRPNVVIVDLGLPDGCGMALISHLTSASTPMQGIIAMSGHDPSEWQERAIEAGAKVCLQKPIPSLKSFQECILGVLPDAASRRGPDEQRQLALMDRASMRTAFSEDLTRAKSLLEEAVRTTDDETIAYCAQFVGSVGEMLEDAQLTAAAREAAEAPSNAYVLLNLLTERVGVKRSAVRGVA